MKRYHLLCLAIILMLFSLFVPFTSYANQASPFSNIVFFGDSLSDNGNLFTTDLGYFPKSPPYFGGRFTNGPVWSEQFSEYYFRNNNIPSENFAIGGETAIFHNPFNGYLPYSLSASVDSYLLRTILFSDRAGALIVVWIGANDYLPAPEDVEGATNSVIDNIQSNLESLINHGGKNFLVINLPDLARTPYAEVNHLSQRLDALTRTHNAKLAKLVASLKEKYSNIDINLYDINALMTQFLDDPESLNQKYHLNVVDTTVPCWTGGYRLTRDNVSIEEDIARDLAKQTGNHASPYATNNTDVNVKGLAHYIAASPALNEAYTVTKNAEDGAKRCDNPDQHLFWDHVHPTAVAHHVLFAEIQAFVSQNYLPKS